MAGVPIIGEATAVSLYGPSHVELSLDAAAPFAASGASSRVENTASFRTRYRNLPAVGDYDEHRVTLSAGSWTLAVEGWVGASLGRVAVSLDGVQVGVIDQYSSGSTLANRFTFPGVNLRQAGVHRVRFTVLDKNSSSSGTAVRLSHVSFTREGPCAVPEGDLAWTYLSQSVTPRSVGIDGIAYGNGGTGDRVLARLTHGGASVEWGQDFGPLVAGGEYVIFVTRTTEGFVVITSTDVSQPGNSGRIWFSTSFNSGFVAVQTIKGTNEFSVSKPETGLNGKTWLAVGEYSTDTPQPTHYLWHSSDGGQTWRNIKTATNTDTTKNSHFHGCAHDPYNGMRLWSSQGDNTNSTFAYTDNPEDPSPTWTAVTMATNHPLYTETPGQQPTTVGVFPGRLFLSPDRLVTAAMWMSSTATPEDPQWVWQSPNAEVSSSVFGRSPYAQADTRAVVVIPDRLAGTNKAYFVGTGDSGKTWHLLHTMDLSAPGSGSVGVVGPDADGNIYYKSPNSPGNPLPAGTNLMVAPMPTFRVLP